MSEVVGAVEKSEAGRGDQEWEGLWFYLFYFIFYKLIYIFIC